MPIATISISDSELQAMSKMKLRQGFENGLGGWVGVGGELPSGRPIEFLRYLGGPLADCFVVNADISDNPDELLQELISVFGLAANQITRIRNADTLTIDVSGILDNETLHEYLYKVLQLMPEYGFNFDALWDCITDDRLSCMPKHLVVEGLGDLKRRLPRDHNLLVKCLTEYQAELPGRRVSFVDGSPSGGGLRFGDD